MPRQKLCQDCGEPCGPKAKRCWTCYNKSRNLLNKKCPDCGKKINHEAKRCKKCYRREQNQKRRCGACIDCGKTILTSSKRCPECGHVARRTRAYVKQCISCGKAIPKGTQYCYTCLSQIPPNHCIDCGEPIRKGLKNKRCRPCSRIFDHSYKKNCVDCGCPICNQATRCSSCAQRKVRQDPHRRDSEAKRMREQWANAEFNAKTSAAISKALNRPDVQEKRSAAQRTAWENDEERRHKTSETSKAMWQDPEYRRRKSGLQKALWQDPEYCRKTSEAIRASLNNPETRLKMSEAAKAKWASGCYDGVFQSPTSIELETAAALDICGVQHRSQFRPAGYSRIYDEFIPPNILIELHGDHFHSEESFPGIEKRDAEKAAWAKEHDYTIVIFWEHEIKEFGAWSLIVSKVLPLLED